MISLPDLLTLDLETVNDNENEIVARLENYVDGADFRIGALNNLVAHLYALLQTGLEEVHDQIRASFSLQEITANPTLADDDQVDAILSNFQVTRLQGTSSSGTIRVVLEGLFSTAIPAGSTFSVQSQSFVVTQAYRLRTSSLSVLDSSDILLTAMPDGTGRYYADLSVVSVETGIDTRIRRNTRLVPNFGIPRLSEVFAVSDFSGGLDDETNEELISRLKDGAALKAPSNRLTTAALIRSLSGFELTDVSECGYGDAEQQRYHSLLPIAYGGRRDVWVRTDKQLNKTTLQKTLTRIGISDLFQFTITKDEVPGFYGTSSIVSSDGQKTFTVESDTRGFDLTGESLFVPDIEEDIEARFTAYQTAVIVVSSDESVTSSSIEANVEVEFTPGIRELQDYFSDRENRPSESDLLIRAAVPCTVRINVEIYKSETQSSPSSTDIQVAVATVVNDIKWTGRLTVAEVHRAVLSITGTDYVIGQTEIVGSVRKPDGEFFNLFSTTMIEIPDTPEELVSRKTVAFFCDPEDVTVNVQTVPRLL